MSPKTSSAIAHPNIAFIKYWGNVDHDLRIPENGSISMNLAGLETRTSVTFDPNLTSDALSINSDSAPTEATSRVSKFLDHVRKLAGIKDYASVESSNNFPSGAGIASSSSAFAALAISASSAAGLSLSEPELSALARLGSGSASRSVPGGFVEWYAGDSHETSYAESIALPDHWDLADCIAIVNPAHKTTGSTTGHKMAETSPLQTNRVADAPRRLDECRTALLGKDFDSFASIVEHDTNMMHAVMMTSVPQLIYLEPGTIAVMRTVTHLRDDGVQACYTIDAGPNVHVICLNKFQDDVVSKLQGLADVQEVIIAAPGGPAREVTKVN